MFVRLISRVTILQSVAQIWSTQPLLTSIYIIFLKSPYPIGNDDKFTKSNQFK